MGSCLPVPWLHHVRVSELCRECRPAPKALGSELALDVQNHLPFQPQFLPQNCKLQPSEELCSVPALVIGED